MLQQRIARSMQSFARQSPLRPQTPIASLSSRLRLSGATMQPRSTIRLYSATQESESKQEEALKEGAPGPDAQATKEDAKENPVQKELDAKKKDLIDMTDRYKRSVAEYRNLQEQTKREVQAAREFALQRFAKDLLDSVDNLDRALSTVPAEKLTGDNKELVDLHSGLKMTEEILLGTLKKHGLERFDPSVEGDAFDPNKHEATFQTPQPDKKDGSVFYTQSKGFLYNGRVLRAAKVGVVKNS